MPQVDWERVLVEIAVEGRQDMIGELIFVVVGKRRSGLEDQLNMLNCHKN